MKITFYLILFSIAAFSCNNSGKEIIEGDLFFKFLALRTFEQPDSVITKIENFVNTSNSDTLNKQGKIIFKHYQFLAKNNLLRSPFIMLKLDNGDKKPLFLSKPDYEKIKNFSFNDLSEENKQIRIKAEVKEIAFDSNSVYLTIRLIAVNKIDGITEWEK